jgi:hypothetical protein
MGFKKVKTLFPLGIPKKDNATAPPYHSAPSSLLSTSVIS